MLTCAPHAHAPLQAVAGRLAAATAQAAGAEAARARAQAVADAAQRQAGLLEAEKRELAARLAAAQMEAAGSGEVRPGLHTPSGCCCRDERRRVPRNVFALLHSIAHA